MKSCCLHSNGVGTPRAVRIACGGDGRQALRIPAEELVPFPHKLLEVPPELTTTALDLELQDGTVIADDLDGRRCVFLTGLYRAEREIADKLEALAAGKPHWRSRGSRSGRSWRSSSRQ